MVILSTFLTPLCILASWESIKKRVKEYMIAFLILETVMIGMFSSVDIFLFYIFKNLISFQDLLFFHKIQQYLLQSNFDLTDFQPLIEVYY